MKKRSLKVVIIIMMVFALIPSSALAKGASVGVNITLKQDVSEEILETLSTHGRVLNVFEAIDSLVMRVKESDIQSIQALEFVASVSMDAERLGSPIDMVSVSDFKDGLSTWNLDVMNVTDIGFDNRVVDQDGSGVYVAVLDTGLLDSWRKYFPQERIAVEYAKSFGGGGGNGVVSEQPNKWEHDVNGHGTHVTSSILGYSLGGTPVNGVAPMATIIPVKVLNQNGRGWSSVISQGILYVKELKEGPLKDYPVIINMSLGGSVLDDVEKAAIDAAIEAGVIIVASAGNSGEDGMGYPGAYEPVISVAASGWLGEWSNGEGNWWYTIDDPEPNISDFYYITDFSSRELEGQDLDVAAPGSWIVGPYQLNRGNRLAYYFLGGTSMASPHVAGLVALMAQKQPTLNNVLAESILETTATPLAAGSLEIATPSGLTTVSWGDDATGAGVVNAQAALGALNP